MRDLRLLGTTILALSGLLDAQIVVDPGGSGHYRDLQSAIDGASSGALIKVIGGSYGALKITKSLTIIGAPAPSIAAPESGSGQQPPAITLSGSGTNDLTLANIKIQGRTNGINWNYAGSAIAGSGFREVRIVHSVVHAPVWFQLTGSGRGEPAIDLTNASGTRLVIAKSDLRASNTDTDYPYDRWALDGPPGVRAPGATVVVLDSKVAGGNSWDTYWRGTAPTPSPCPCGSQGVGGAGIEAGTVFVSGSQVSGGIGGSVFFSTTGQPPWTPWGRQSDGPPYRVTTLVQLTSISSALNRLLIGQNFDLQIAVPGSRASVLFAGDLSRAPIPALGSWFFIDAARIYFTVYLPPNTSSLRIPVPNDPSLAGIPVTFQIYDLATLFGPVFDVIGY